LCWYVLGLNILNVNKQSMAPKTMRALTDIGVLLSTVLSCKGSWFLFRVWTSIQGMGALKARVCFVQA